MEAGQPFCTFNCESGLRKEKSRAEKKNVAEYFMKALNTGADEYKLTVLGTLF